MNPKSTAYDLVKLDSHYNYEMELQLWKEDMILKTERLQRIS